MTTKVTITVEADGPWDAMVTERVKYSDDTIHSGMGTRVCQGESADFWIHDSLGFKITEVACEPEVATDEDEPEESPPDDAEDGPEVATEDNEGQDGTDAIGAAEEGAAKVYGG